MPHLIYRAIFGSYPCPLSFRFLLFLSFSPFRFPPYFQRNSSFTRRQSSTGTNYWAAIYFIVYTWKKEQKKTRDFFSAFNFRFSFVLALWVQFPYGWILIFLLHTYISFTYINYPSPFPPPPTQTPNLPLTLRGPHKFPPEAISVRPVAPKPENKQKVLHMGYMCLFVQFMLSSSCRKSYLFLGFLFSFLPAFRGLFSLGDLPVVIKFSTLYKSYSQKVADHPWLFFSLCLPTFSPLTQTTPKPFVKFGFRTQCTNLTPFPPMRRYNGPPERRHLRANLVSYLNNKNSKTSISSIEFL